MDDYRTAPAAAWHTVSAGDAAATTATDAIRGLAGPEAAARLARDGPNALAAARRRSVLGMLAGQLNDVMIILLLVAAAVAALLGERSDVITILVIIAVDAIIGVVQEYRAEQAMAALQALAAATATVVRDGAVLAVPADALVAGDVVLLEAGNIVPADVRVIEARRLLVDESLLTGESVTVAKSVAALEHADAPLAERTCLAFRGSRVTQGRGRAIVIATGMRTELGRIAHMLDSGRLAATPLQRRLAAFGRRIAVVVIAICAVLLVVGLLRGEPPVLMAMTAISLAVAAIPEALPAVVTVLLALSARRLARGHALVRRLPAVETLGSVTVICSDKTGTLTRNEMRVHEVWLDGERMSSDRLPARNRTLTGLSTAIAHCNDAATGHGGADPTEVALLEFAAQHGVQQEAGVGAAPRLLELPFSAERKRMTTVHAAGNAFVAYVKGAPETVLPACERVLLAGGEVPLDRAGAERAAAAMAADGLRVLAVAIRRLDLLPATDDDAIESELCLLGLVGLLDPPRQEARNAVDVCIAAGIRPVMITGDHPATARAIASALGITGPDGRVITGAELSRLSDAELADAAAAVRVYARVDPAQKVRIVDALQAQGHVVAMTGDGVNDAPALRRADIGVAMGRGGTDVAREAASLVLLDNNFGTIVAAVGEGRRVYDNVRKFVRYAMTGNSAELATLFLAPLLGMPLPLLPIHILWVNLVTDGLPGVAIAAEPADRSVMRRGPRSPRESLFARGMWQHILWVGIVMAAVTLGIQAWALERGNPHWQTMVFTVLTLAQMAHVLAVRSERESLFAQGLGSNVPLLLAVLSTVGLQLALLYVPALNTIFRTQPLEAGELALCALASAVVFVAVEIEKALVRRGLLYA